MADYLSFTGGKSFRGAQKSMFPFGFLADLLRIAQHLFVEFDSFHTQTIMWAVQNLVVDSRLLQVVNSVFTLFYYP